MRTCDDCGKRFDHRLEHHITNMWFYCNACWPNNRPDPESEMPKDKPAPIHNDNGLTVKELREYLAQFPDEGTVWLANYDDPRHTNAAFEAWPLDRRSVLLKPREKT